MNHAVMSCPSQQPVSQRTWVQEIWIVKYWSRIPVILRSLCKKPGTQYVERLLKCDREFSGPITTIWSNSTGKKRSRLCFLRSCLPAECCIKHPENLAGFMITSLCIWWLQSEFTLVRCPFWIAVNSWIQFYLL